MIDLYALLAEMAARGESGAVATVIRTARSTPRHEGSKLVVRADGSIAGSIGGGALEAAVIAAAREVMGDGRCRRLQYDLTGDLSACGGEIELFLEPVCQQAPLLVIGAGHVGRALALMARELPLLPTVVDDRPEQLAELAPLRTLAAGPAELAANWSPTPRALVLIASRHHELDGDYLEAVLEAELRAGCVVAYLGCVGSRAKARQLRRRLAGREDAGLIEERLAIPAGLAIGAETPAELALSILAEMAVVVRGAGWTPDAAGRPAGVWLQRRRPDATRQSGPEQKP